MKETSSLQLREIVIRSRESHQDKEEIIRFQNIYAFNEDTGKLNEISLETCGVKDNILDLTNTPTYRMSGSYDELIERIIDLLELDRPFIGVFILKRTKDASGKRLEKPTYTLLYTSNEIAVKHKYDLRLLQRRFVQFRWSYDDGKLRADRAILLRGKIIEFEQVNADLKPSIGAIATAIANNDIKHRLCDEWKQTKTHVERFCALQKKYPHLTPKKMLMALQETLIKKLDRAHVEYTRNIPTYLTVSIEDVLPNSTQEMRECGGEVLIPGLGYRFVSEDDVTKKWTKVFLHIDELRHIKDWPFSHLDIEIYEFDHQTLVQNDSTLHTLLHSEGNDRWEKIFDYIVSRWEKLQKQISWSEPDYNQKFNFTAPAEAQPIAWSVDPKTGQPYIQYPTIFIAIISRKGNIGIKWGREYEHNQEIADAQNKQVKEELEILKEKYQYPVLTSEKQTFLHTSKQLKPYLSSKTRESIERTFVKNDFECVKEVLKAILSLETEGGKIIIDFEGQDSLSEFSMLYRAKSEDGWVINQSGQIKEPTISNKKKTWTKIEPSDLIIGLNTNLRKDKKCYVLHCPKGGATKEQIETVKKIEEDERKKHLINQVPGWKFTS